MKKMKKCKQTHTGGVLKRWGVKKHSSPPPLPPSDDTVLIRVKPQQPGEGEPFSTQPNPNRLLPLFHFRLHSPISGTVQRLADDVWNLNHAIIEAI